MQVIVTHDVDDVEHWFNSPKRAEFVDQHPMKATAFRQPGGDEKLVAVLIETPDIDTLRAALDTDEARAAVSTTASTSRRSRCSSPGSCESGSAWCQWETC